MKKIIIFCSIVICMFLAVNVNATTYWVKKTGSDGNSCIGEANACLTINKGLSLANQPGDIVYVGPGTYIESGETSPYVPGQGCGLLDGNISSLCVQFDGTESQPITLSAAPGFERQAIIDSQFLRSGISLGKHDYVNIKNLVWKNSYVGAITNPGGPAITTGPQLESNLSIGCVIEGNVVDSMETPDGTNSSGIYFWSTKNWVIRNNYIDPKAMGTYVSTYPLGMQTYGALNVLIEYNTIVNTKKGIFFKDHYIQSANPTVHTDEGIVRNNFISTNEYGILFLIRGTDTNPAGNNEVYNNIIEMRGNGVSGISSGTGAHSISGSMNIHNNIIVSNSTVSSVGISVSSSTNLTINNNIVMGFGNNIRCTKSDYTCNLNASNYNIFDTRSTFVMDNNSPNERSYSTLTLWKQANGNDTDSLNFSNPDANSISALYTNFVKKRVMFYRNFPNDIGGQKAGLYINGTERVGADFTYKAAPTAPN